MNRALGRYRLIAELGRGGMGTVYLAALSGPARFSKVVVIKQLRPGFAEDPNLTSMFLEEARLAARLHHPNIVQTNEVVCDPEDGYFIVMEYLEGAALKRVVRRLRRHGDEPARSIYIAAILDVLGALQYAHALKDFDGKPMDLVHRDVNPANVVVTFGGQVKLVDFGIAKAADSAQETRAGILKGKLHYMSPEQMAGDRIDCRADLFAVGAMLWDALAGRKLWEGTSGLDVMTSLVRGNIPSPRSVNPDIGPDLERVCMRALAFRPEDRYPDAGSFHADLEHALGSARMPAGEIGAAIQSEFAEEQEHVRALIAEQLSLLNDQSAATGRSEPPPLARPDASGEASAASAASVLPPASATAKSSPGTTELSDTVSREAKDEVIPDLRRPPGIVRRVAATALAGAVIIAVAFIIGRPVRTSSPSAASSPEPIAPVEATASPPPPVAPSAAPAASQAVAPAPSGEPTARPRRARRALRHDDTSAQASAAATPPDAVAGPANDMGATAPIPPAPPEEAATKGEAGPVVAPPASASAAATAPAATTAPTAQPAPAATPATRRTLPAEAVRAVVRAHSSEIQDCVERAQMEQPLLRARVAVSATVGRGGQVSAVTTSAAGGGTARLRACIQSAWQGWTFPEPPGGEPARISYTFVFE